MWRIFNGFSRGFRGKTPAPPSQTSPWCEENESGGSATNIIRVENCDTIEQSCQTVSQAPIAVHRTRQWSENANEIAQRILGKPSEADILLREFFGPSWKRSDNKQKRNQEDNDIPEHIRNGFGFGTVWMTAIVLGRAVFTNWRNHSRRREISCDNVTSWHEFEERYINKMRELYYPSKPIVMERPRCWNAIFHVLPKTSSHGAILAAGSDIVDTKKTLQKASSDKTFSIKIESDVPKYNLQNDTSSLKQQKSVTFDEESFGKEELSGSCDEETDSFSEEAIEQFTEDARNCSGATYNILGLQSIKSGKKVEAFQRFQLASREGYSKAHFNLALCYERGFGTKKDKNKAMEIYEKAAFKGHVKAQYNLALLLLKEKDTTHKIHAIRLLEKSAMSGFVQEGGLRAPVSHLVVLSNTITKTFTIACSDCVGWNIPGRREASNEAYTWQTIPPVWLSSELKAQSYLGTYYAKPGAFHDMKKAVKMFTKAAEQGDAKSKYHLGICHERGLGGLKQDFSKAFDLYSSAAVSDHLDAQYNMAVMLQKGFDDTDKNPKLAEELLNKAAKKGHKPSSRRLKEMILSKNVSSRHEIKTKSNQAYKVYHSDGKPTASRLTEVSTNQSRQSESMEGVKLRQLVSTTKLQQANSILMPSMLSQHISNLSLIDRLQMLPLDNGQQSSVRQDFDLATRLVNDPITDAVQDLLSLRRVSTTPANLCYLSPMINEPLNTFSLEV